MRIFDYFKSNNKKDSATIARERLQVIVAHQRQKRSQPDYLPRMQQEILDVIQKYVTIDQNQVEVQVDQNGGCSVLELNITLPEK